MFNNNDENTLFTWEKLCLIQYEPHSTFSSKASKSSRWSVTIFQLSDFVDPFHGAKLRRRREKSFSSPHRKYWESKQIANSEFSTSFLVQSIPPIHTDCELYWYSYARSEDSCSSFKFEISLPFPRISSLILSILRTKTETFSHITLESFPQNCARKSCIHRNRRNRIWERFWIPKNHAISINWIGKSFSFTTA